MVLNAYKFGLKEEIRMQLLKDTFRLLKDWQDRAIVIDEELSNARKISTSTGSRKTQTNVQHREQGAKRTSAQASSSTGKAPVYLPKAQYEECKKNGWCTLCFKEGKKIKGFIETIPIITSNKPPSRPQILRLQELKKGRIFRMTKTSCWG